MSDSGRCRDSNPRWIRQVGSTGAACGASTPKRSAGARRVGGAADRHPSLSARSSKRGPRGPFCMSGRSVSGIRTLDGMCKRVRPASLAAPARRSEAQAPGGWAAQPTVIPRSSPDPVKGLDGPFCMSVHVANGPGVFEHCAELCVKRCDDCCDGKVSRRARPFTFRCPGQLRGVRPPGRRRARGYGRRSSRRDHPLPVAG